VEDARGNRHAGGVIGNGEKPVLADVAHGGARQSAGIDNTHQITS